MSIYKRTLYYFLLLWFLIGPVGNSFSQKKNNITIISGKGSLSISPNEGARINSLRYDSLELLSEKEIHPIYFGSSLWLSPSKIYWPPSEVLDQAPYTYKKQENGYVFKSLNDKTLNLRYIKEVYPVDSERIISFSIHYTITNIGQNNKSLAAWQVTRLPKDGISFFPVGQTQNTKYKELDPSIKMIRKNGIIWHAYEPGDTLISDNHSKFFCDGSEGWIAFINKKHLFVKHFPDVDPANFAPDETDIEIYVKDVLPYIEIEIQSAYETLFPGQSLYWSVNWFLTSIPDSINIDEKNKNLIDFTRSVIENR